MGWRVKRRWPGFLTALAAALALAGPAQAAFPGQNGKIAFNDGGEIWAMNPDGSGAVNLTNDGEGAASFDPAWSPDGAKIVSTYALSFDHSDLQLMNADGSGRQFVPRSSDFDDLGTWSPDGGRLVFNFSFDGGNSGMRTMKPDGTDVQSAGSGGSPAWSPDGTKIAFSRARPSVCPTCWAISMSNPDGSDVTDVYVNTAGVASPNWSPTGGRLVFQRNGSGSSEIYAVDVDGTDLTNLTNHPAGDIHPAWSPDGSKVVFFSSRDPNGIYVMNADGTNQSFVRFGHEPDWQPIPVNGYPRPKAASPQHISLVPAYQQCTSPNRAHGPPLGFPSCAPPQREPGQLTVGTPDSNGKPAKNVGELWIAVMLGIPSTPADEADVHIYGEVRDVRLASDLSDYTGSLEARVNLRITDKDNTPHPGGPGAATVEDLPYTFPIPCSPTADATIGSACPFDTTAEALLPGAVKEGRRAIWQLGQLSVHDAGGDVFLRQGVFIP